MAEGKHNVEENSNILARTGVTDDELLNAVAILKGGTDVDRPPNLKGNDVHAYVAGEIEKLNMIEDANVLTRQGMNQEDAVKKATMEAARRRKVVDKAIKSYTANK